MLIPNFFPPGVKPSSIDGSMLAHTVTNKKQWNGARKWFSGDPTPILKSVPEEFELNHNNWSFNELTSLWESNRVFTADHIFGE